jgi:hypothetical protein
LSPLILPDGINDHWREVEKPAMNEGLGRQSQAVRRMENGEDASVTSTEVCRSEAGC